MSDVGDVLESVAVRLRAARRGLDELVPRYEAALRSKTLPLHLAHAVERVATDQRPALDYLAHRLIEEAGGSATRQSQYPLERSVAAFDAQLSRNLPRLDARLELVDLVRQRQPYVPGYEWLPRLSALANSSKHVDLVAQTRVEEHLREIKGPGGSVSWGPGVTFSGNVSIGGAPIHPRTQRPEFLPSGMTYNETTYVDWLLPDGHGALSSLREFQDGVERIVTDIAAAVGWRWPLTTS